MTRTDTSWFADFATIFVIEFEGAGMFAWRRWVMFLADPLSYTLFLAVGIGSQVGGEGYLDFVIPGVMCIQSVSSMTMMIYRTTIERRWGLGSLKLQSGVSRSAYLLGLLSVPLVVFYFKATVVALIGLVLGVDTGVGAVAAAVVCAGALSIFWATVGVSVTSVIDNYRDRDFFVGMLVTPLMFAAPTFYALDSAPTFLRVLSHANPLTYGLSLTRGVFSGTGVGWEGVLCVALAVTSLVVAGLSLSRLRTAVMEP